MSISIFKPDEVNIKNGLFGSSFNKREFETIAFNIVLISVNSGNQWINFSEEDYQEMCSHDVTPFELMLLNEMADRGFLDLNDGKFSVNLKFLGLLSEFVNK